MNELQRACLVAVVGTGLALAQSDRLLAHCDSLDGPVVKAAEQALATGNVNLVLIWVRPTDERAITDAFRQTSAVRKLGAAAQHLADRYFFETLVRLHRAGEGAPYTGLQPAGSNLGPAIAAADRAVHQGGLDPVRLLLSTALENGLRERYENVMSRQNFQPDDVAADREYVESYVEFIHYVERMYEAATSESPGPEHR